MTMTDPGRRLWERRLSGIPETAASVTGSTIAAMPLSAIQMIGVGVAAGVLTWFVTGMLSKGAR